MVLEARLRMSCEFRVRIPSRGSVLFYRCVLAQRVGVCIRNWKRLEEMTCCFRGTEKLITMEGGEY